MGLDDPPPFQLREIDCSVGRGNGRTVQCVISIPAIHVGLRSVFSDMLSLLYPVSNLASRVKSIHRFISHANAIDTIKGP